MSDSQNDQNERREFIEDVLHYGYHPGCDGGTLPPTVQKAANMPKFDAPLEELIERGVRALETTFDAAIRDVDSTVIQVVPLSGGLDSRTILAGLLRHPRIKSDQIQTVTFGSPGTWDFEIGQRVASEAGVSNTAIDLSSSAFDWSLESIGEYARGCETPIKMLEGYINDRVSSFVDSADAVYWSGWMGEALAGKDTPSSSDSSWEETCKWFSEWSRGCELDLTPDGYDPTASLPDEPWLSPDRLPYRDQITYSRRQQCFTKRLIDTQSERYQFPFVRPEWVSFILRVPPPHRAGRALFKRIVKRVYPHLFALPTDETRGLRFTAPKWRVVLRSQLIRVRLRLASLLGLEMTNPWTNYVDFDRQFRRPTELKDVVETLISDVESRGVVPWVDVESIWSEHQRGANHSDALRILASIELYLKTR